MPDGCVILVQNEGERSTRPIQLLLDLRDSEGNELPSFYKGKNFDFRLRINGTRIQESELRDDHILKRFKLIQAYTRESYTILEGFNEFSLFSTKVEKAAEEIQLLRNEPPLIPGKSTKSSLEIREELEAGFNIKAVCWKKIIEILSSRQCSRLRIYAGIEIPYSRPQDAPVDIYPDRIIWSSKDKYDRAFIELDENSTKALVQQFINQLNVDTNTYQSALKRIEQLEADKF